MNSGAGTTGTIPQAQYDATAITAGASNPAQTVRIGVAGTVTIGAGNATISVLAVRAALTNLNFTNATDVLNLASGGLALTNGGTTVGTVAIPGRITAGNTQSTGIAPLYVFSGGANNTINSIIQDNGSGAKTRLVVTALANQLNLAAPNTHTGGTAINGGGGGVTLTGAASTVVIPAGGLTLNNVTLTMSANAGQIEQTNAVTLNGGSVLTLTGTNTLNSLTFNNTGGTTTPSVAAATNLALTATNAITAVNDNMATIPTISGTLLTLPAGANIDTSTTAAVPTGLIISAPMASAGAINKVNTGGLLLSGNSTFAGGFNLNSGTLLLGLNSTPTTGTVTSGPVGIGTLTLGDGTALLSDTTIRTIANAVSINGNVTFGTLSAASGSASNINGVLLSGPVALGSAVSRTIHVNSLQNISTISGIVSGTGSSITKTGPGTLVLTGANTFDGGITINGGVVQSNATGLGSTGTITFGGGILQHALSTATDFSSRFSTASNQPFYIDTNGQTITYASPLTSAVGGSLGKFGTGTLILTNTEVYDGPTIIAAGTLQVGSGASLGAIPATTNIADSGTLYINHATTDPVIFASITGGGGLTIDQHLIQPTGPVNLGGTLLFGNTPLSSSSLTNGTNTVGTLDLSNTGANSNFGAVTAQTNSTGIDIVTIPSGRTLTVGGNVTVGFAVGVATSTAQTNLTFNGGGSLVVNNPAAVVAVGVAAGVQLNISTANTLNLATLANANLGTVAAPITTLNVGFGQNAGGTLLLSNTANTIAATTINVGHSNGANGGVGSIILGTGTNAINADTINIGFSKIDGTVKFVSQAAGSPGSVTIGNKAGTAGANINVGSNNGTGTAAVLTGTLDLRGHVATVVADIVSIGNNNNTLGGAATGVLSMDAGTFTANTLNLGLKSAAGTGSNTAANSVNFGGGAFTVAGATTMSNHTGTAGGNVTSALNVTDGAFTTATLTAALKNGSGGGTATGNINVSGGSFAVTGSSFVLASQASAGTAVGSLNITGGAVTTAADITDGGGATTTSVTVNGGALDLTGHNLGSATTLIDTLSFQAGTLSNAGEINNGAVFTKTTNGTLSLPTANAYTGATVINGGVLSVANLAKGGINSSLGKSSNAASNLVINGATLQFNGSANGSTDRQFTIGSNATLDASGIAALDLTSTAAPSYSAPDVAELLTLTGSAAGNLAASVTDNGAGQTSLTKSGVGVWTLSGTNTLTGITTVSNGGLIVGNGTSGTLLGSMINVNGGNLGGLGTVGTINANLSGTVDPGLLPGLSTGRLNTGDVNFAAGSIFNVQLGGTNAGATIAGYDQLNVTGGLTIAGDLHGERLGGFIAPGNSIFTIAINDGSDAILGEFGNATLNLAFSDTYKSVIFDGQAFLVSYHAEGGVFDAGATGNDIALMAIAVPEPGAALLLIGGLAVSMARRRKRTA